MDHPGGHLAVVLFLFVLVSMSTENNITIFTCSHSSDLVMTWLDVASCLDWIDFM